MAASANHMASFTITQPFLGAPLQFQPALGSQELEELIDTYVVGPASKQDKLSEVTIDFYNRATVDLSNGSLVRRYDVNRPSRTVGQSPTQSQSSGFSPIFTPSPGSSATFADSSNASASMTPPHQSRHARVSRKPARKETKKTAELRLPGFSIMTKDGIDVTSTAGRGTKTKEQREHAHLMRIMKACEECKRKKIRCDPSHKRSYNGSSAASTSSATTKTSSPSRQNPSPASSGPPPLQESRHVSNTGDFILFPESDFGWNPTDINSEFDNQACDLSNFDFDINSTDFGEFTTLNEDDSFDWSFTQPSFPIERYPSDSPLIGDPYSFGQWTQPEGYSPLSVANHGDTSLQDSEQAESSLYMRNLRGINSSDRSRPSATIKQWPELHEFFGISPGMSFSSTSESLEESFTSLSSQSEATSLDWTPGNAGSSNCSSQSSQTEGSSPDASQLSTSNAKLLSCGRKRRHDQPFQASPGEHFASQSSRSPTSWDSLEQLVQSTGQSLIPTGTLFNQHPPFRGINANAQFLDLEPTSTMVAEGLAATTPTSDDYLSLSVELKRFRRRLDRLQYSGDASIESDNVGVAGSLLEDLTSQLQVLVTRVKNVLNYGSILSEPQKLVDDERRLQQRLLQANARHLVWSLCATITSLEVLNRDSTRTTGNNRVLTSRYNQQLVLSLDQRRRRDVRLISTPPQEDLTVFSVLDAPMTIGLTALQQDRSDDSGQRNRNRQLEIVGLLLPVIMVASSIAVSVSSASVAQLALQVFVVIVATSILWAGNGQVVNATVTAIDQHQTSIFSSPNAMQSPHFMAVAASLLRSSTNSSEYLTSSSKRTSSKIFRRSRASHWFGILQRLSIRSSMR